MLISNHSSESVYFVSLLIETVLDNKNQLNLYYIDVIGDYAL